MDAGIRDPKVGPTRGPKGRNGLETSISGSGLCYSHAGQTVPLENSFTGG